MPFINGRYYVNPIMGEALELAREAEGELAGLTKRLRATSDAPQDERSNAIGDVSTFLPQSAASDAPIHRVEIEAVELVPPYSGSAARGYVARVRRQPASDTAKTPASAGDRRANKTPGSAETHVFTDHRDLVSFLRDEFTKDRESHSSR
jgi:hypothetical protein